MTPMQVRGAYDFDSITFSLDGQSIQGDGSGQTIAIVSAYNHTSIFQDVDAFTQAFSIDGSQTLYQQYGPSSGYLTRAAPQGTPGADPDGLWLLETAMDVQWAHAMAPGADILLVEARSGSFQDLMDAVDFARNQPGVSVVSMSWGVTEFEGQAYYAANFATPANHLGGSNGRGGPLLPGGVTFVAASGDSGTPGLWPAVSSKVLAVGGTTLEVSSSGTYISEAAWPGSGGSVSAYEPKPSFQEDVNLSQTQRSIPDVAYHADQDNGFYVYHSLPVGGTPGTWWAVGGTSAGTPQWAALVAIANQGRALNGYGSLDGPSETLPAIYDLPAASFHDIVSGSNGLPAGPGFDLVTGLGSPHAELVVQGLAEYQTLPSPPPPTSRTIRPIFGKDRRGESIEAPATAIVVDTTFTPVASTIEDSTGHEDERLAWSAHAVDLGFDLQGYAQRQSPWEGILRQSLGTRREQPTMAMDGFIPSPPSELITTLRERASTVLVEGWLEIDEFFSQVEWIGQDTFDRIQ